MNKPVEVLTEYELDKFSYYAFKAGLNGNIFYGSDSLKNLKRKIKELGWWQAWIVSTDGMMASGQILTDTIAYTPKY